MKSVYDIWPHRNKAGPLSKKYSGAEWILPRLTQLPNVVTMPIEIKKNPLRHRSLIIVNYIKINNPQRVVWRKQHANTTN